MPRELERFQELLMSFARDHAGAVAVKGDAHSYTYRQLLGEVGLRAHVLHRQPAGALVLALDNGPDLLFWDLAAL
ncbi:MAG: long-chain acyl-CoA synthetase, partial [Pseudomonas sp.]|nr:long-chain acyl-CoA synthetase [Pseudomonas sp.]